MRSADGAEANTTFSSSPPTSSSCSAKANWRSVSPSGPLTGSSVGSRCRFARIDGEPAVVVGGLQGPASAYKREIIDATRDLYGLRPKDAALLAARAFARALGFNVLHAVCDANHVLRRLQGTAKFSHYDDYWLERGGIRGGPFGFVFGPLEATAPSGDRRDATKAAVVAGMEAFVAAHRALRRPPDGDLCAPPDSLHRPGGRRRASLAEFPQMKAPARPRLTAAGLLS